MIILISVVYSIGNMKKTQCPSILKKTVFFYLIDTNTNNLWMISFDLLGHLPPMTATHCLNQKLDV